MQTLSQQGRSDITTSGLWRTVSTERGGVGSESSTVQVWVDARWKTAADLQWDTRACYYPVLAQGRVTVLSSGIRSSSFGHDDNGCR